MRQNTIEVMDHIEDPNVLEFCNHVADDIARQLNLDREPGAVGGAYRVTSGNSLLLMRNGHGEPISLIAWQEWDEGAFIGLAWTDARYRRRGLYRELMNRLEQECQKRDLRQIAASVHGNNHDSLEAHMKIMGEPWIVTFRKGI